MKKYRERWKSRERERDVVTVTAREVFSGIRIYVKIKNLSKMKDLLKNNEITIIMIIINNNKNNNNNSIRKNKTINEI